MQFSVIDQGTESHTLYANDLCLRTTGSKSHRPGLFSWNSTVVNLKCIRLSVLSSCRQTTKRGVDATNHISLLNDRKY